MATRLFEEALALSFEVGDRGNSAYGLEGLAWVAATRGSRERAARLWGAAQMLIDVGEAAVYAHAPDRSLHESAVAEVRSKLGEQQWAAAWEQGRTMTPERAVEYALTATDLEFPADPM